MKYRRQLNIICFICYPSFFALFLVVNAVTISKKQQSFGNNKKIDKV